MQRIVVALIITAVTLIPQPSNATSSKIFAWEVKKGNRTLYLVGSIHLANASLYPLDPAFIKAFDKSDTLVVEADITNPESAMGAQLVMIQKGVYPPGTTIASELSEETFNALKDYTRKRGVNLLIFQQLKPWALAITLTVTELTNLGFSQEYGIDSYFLKKAKKEGKNVRELESVLFQIEMLSGFDREDQELFLASSLEEMDKLKEAIDLITEAWSDGDHVVLDLAAVADLRGSKEFRSIYKAIYSDRNIGMVKKIKGYLEEEGTFFVIAGAAHMVGKGGIVALLKNDGYTVRQISCDDCATAK